MAHRRPIGSRAVRGYAPGQFVGPRPSASYWPGRPRERPHQCPAPGCEAMVLPSQASTPAGHCAAHAEHYRPSVGPRRGRRQTECSKGHDLTISENVTRNARGRRVCRVCLRAREAEARRARQAAARIMELHREGLIQVDIAKRLTDEGVPTARGGRWHQSSVGHIIRRELAREQDAA
jgi:hypothetical protein